MTTDVAQGWPLDLHTMRACAERLLAHDVVKPSPEELETLTLQLRGHVLVALPEVETAVLALPEDAVPRACGLFCIAEARLRLGGEPGLGHLARVAYAQRLARSVRVLCDHYADNDHQCPSGPERAVYLRMLQHYPACPDCRTVGDGGGGLVGTCTVGVRLYEEYRQARRRPS
ncbi:predicted protein [Streptomyces viridochromogenes DSM 40736]|uniref:Predicted protein n=1 Tax=Streptomyces viridochromogenes (strain DSM 40736 / JCM 4977 / BCRC 1201 / Tue 494) TaxID=591159 RepID=D9WYV0_STRVT|nr:DUF6415 family natural product biosynthesis protein [Streptomyces viridochromogenes]EFL33229.1 predicted protein [Streptomyces viridochromogenes DSM 40736]